MMWVCIASVLVLLMVRDERVVCEWLFKLQQVLYVSCSV